LTVVQLLSNEVVLTIVGVFEDVFWLKINFPKKYKMLSFSLTALNQSRRAKCSYIYMFCTDKLSAVQ